MNLTPELQTLLLNIATIAGEVLVVVVAFVVLNFVFKRVFAAIVATPALAGARGVTTVLQKNLRLLLLLLSVFGALAIIGVNLYWMYLGHYLPEHTLELAHSIPRELWISTAIAIGKVLALVVVAAVVLRYMRRFVGFLCDKTQKLDSLQANDAAIAKLFGSLQLTITVSVWLVVLAVATAWLGLPAAVPAAVLLALRIFLIVAVGILIWRAVGALVDSADAMSKQFVARTRFTDTYDRLRPLVPVLRRSVEYVVMVTVATLVIMQVEAIANLAIWGPRVIQVIGIVFMARAVKELAMFLLEETMLRKAGLTPQQKQRRTTLVPLFGSILTYAIYFVAGVLILNVFGINPTPILAGAGIAGLAVGLGAQNLINDMVSGFFILFEEHYLVGDFVRIEDAEGWVESIDLRTTRIRDNAGRHHIIRNGQINDLIHYSKDYTNAVVEVGVAYESDLNKVFEVLKATGEQLKTDNDMVLEATSVKGLDNFGESDMVIRTVTRVKPGCHLPVERDLRKRIKDAFDANDIEIPYARRVLITKSEPAAEAAA